MKRILLFLITCIFTSCTQHQVRFAYDKPIEMAFADSLIVNIVNDGDLPVEYSTSNMLVAGIDSSGKVKAAFSGSATLYAKTKNGIDSILVNVSNDNLLSLVPPCTEFGSTSEEVIEYEKSFGFTPILKTFHNSKISANVPAIKSPRLINGHTANDIEYFFDADGKLSLSTLHIPLSVAKSYPQQLAKYMLSLGANVCTLGNGVIVSLRYDGVSKEEYDEKCELMKQGLFSSPKVKDNVCVATTLDPFELILLFYRAQDTNIFPNYVFPL